MTTTQCVSLTTGTLSPDQRVNYAFGMVLGLDEFLQEQLYAQSKHRRHARSAHGFGTVSGLDVTVSTEGTDVQVTVSTGIGVDQLGNEFAVTCDQCAMLGQWLAKELASNPGVLSERAADGVCTVYVVASYDECLDHLVPLPGQPCSSSEQTSVPSRVRDAWDVALTWDRPAMPRWDADRRLARVLANVVVVESLPLDQSDEEDIVAAVLDLAARTDDDLDPLGTGSPPVAPLWRLPADEAADAVDRILAVWVTRVRPVLGPDVVQPAEASSAPVLLSTLTFTPEPDLDPAAPAIESCVADDAGRPYLLHTQLVQEMRGLGGALQRPLAEAVTLTAGVEDGAATVVEAWFHLPDPVRLPGTIDVVEPDGTTHAFTTTAEEPDADGFSARWRLTAPQVGVAASDGLQLAARFSGETVLVGSPGTTLLAAKGLDLYLDQGDDGDLVAYTHVRAEVVPPTVPVPDPVPVPGYELVTIETVSSNVDQLVLELWFHVQPRGTVDDVFAVKPAFRVFDDTSGDEVDFELVGPAPWSRNVWRIAIRTGVEIEGPRQYLRFVFDTKEFGIETRDRQRSLAEWIERTRLQYEGHVPDDATVVVFHLAPYALDGRSRFTAFFERIDGPRPDPLPDPRPFPFPLPDVVVRPVQPGPVVPVDPVVPLGPVVDVGVLRNTILARGVEDLTPLAPAGAGGAAPAPPADEPTPKKAPARKQAARKPAARKPAAKRGTRATKEGESK